MSLLETSESISSLSGSDAIVLLELIHSSLSCNSEEDFIALFPKIQEMMAFDFAFASLGCLENNDIILAHSVNISFPEEWLCEYLSKNYIKVDALVKESFRTYKIQDWSDATKKKVNEPKEITSLCKDFGMREGYMHGSKPLSLEKNGSMFCFSSWSLKYYNRSKAILDLITPHLHLALSGIFNKKQTANNKVVLSIREKEVLNWLKLGKSSWDISVILGISESTANYHVYNTMRKLDASNRPQAVAIAARLGLIDFE